MKIMWTWDKFRKIEGRFYIIFCKFGTRLHGWKLVFVVTAWWMNCYVIALVNLLYAVLIIILSIFYIISYLGYWLLLNNACFSSLQCISGFWWRALRFNQHEKKACITQSRYMFAMSLFAEIHDCCTIENFTSTDIYFVAVTTSVFQRLGSYDLMALY